MTTSTQQPILPRIGVGAVILDDDRRILLVLRNRHPEAGTWSIPGGKVEPYETLEQAVIREIKEEVNLDVEIDRLLCTAETVSPETEEHWVSILYVVRIVGGTVQNREPDALRDVQWFSLDALPENLACFTVPVFEVL
ncbi:NUDIX domain-containing protein [Tumebacillus permanentifrigoris]|uniref:Mutator protein MutT n=1 Tax=Tumebacillus permanentifrigoris TaxID=378543 RepID=A0A316DSU7_9BACL|nr:NUDIX domain-containing protein [Tumebacillus permanentifrigoris]PWK09599.1 mutator protein MutT [Tumebacillus permanentifrigoris]